MPPPSSQYYYLTPGTSYKDNPPLLDVVEFFFISFPPLSYHVDSADGAQTGNVELGEDDCRQP